MRGRPRVAPQVGTPGCIMGSGGIAMAEKSWDDEFREVEREALVEEIRLLRRLSPEELLADYLAFCREAARIEGVPHEVARMLDDRARDAMVDRLDRVIHGS